VFSVRHIHFVAKRNGKEMKRVCNEYLNLKRYGYRSSNRAISGQCSVSENKWRFTLAVTVPGESNRVRRVR